jgi:signal peptidase I
MRVYDDLLIAANSPGAHCGTQSALEQARDDHYGNQSIIQRRAASCGNRKETLREAGLSLRAGLRDFGAVVRQGHQHSARLLIGSFSLMTQATTAADSHALKCELAREVLRTWGKVRLCVTGWSMLPTIWPGDTLLVERADHARVSKGDIVLFGRDHRLFAHRVVAKAGKSEAAWLITRGDGMLRPDPALDGSELLGKVRFVVRDGRRISPGATLNLFERAVSAVVRRSDLAARVVVGLCGMRTHAGHAVGCGAVGVK